MTIAVDLGRKATIQTNKNFITTLHLKTTSGLSILLHGFKLLTDAALCYKNYRQLASTTCISDLLKHVVPIMSME